MSEVVKCWLCNCVVREKDSRYTDVLGYTWHQKCWADMNGDKPS